MRCGGAAGCRTRQDSKPNDTRQWRSAPESRERREQRLTVGAPEPGARIPAGRRLVGNGNTPLTPPPVAPSLTLVSFHTTSLTIEPPRAVSLVPPHASTDGLEAGKST